MSPMVRSRTSSSSGASPRTERPVAPSGRATCPTIVVLVSDLPTGTVAFLMSDIEGSTRLVAGLGDGFPELLDRHFRLLDEVVAQNAGTLVSSEGDSVFAVFPSARQAIAAAAAAQSRLAAHEWPDRAEVKVRIGIHAGEAVLGGRDYTGLDVHRTARITAAAHGGQVLVSDAARILAGGTPDGVSFRDLGVHTLRDLPDAERLHQLVLPGLPNDFPPLRTVTASPPSNLPAPMTRFVGRTRELAQVGKLLEAERLVTLTGPGGTGKTRLAIEAGRAVVHRFPGGVWFVALDVVRDPTLVVPTIAATLGVPERSDRTVAAALAERLERGPTLLVLDNLEQVVAAAPDIASLITAAPNATVLASSREPLAIAGEHVFAVPPLALPSQPGLPRAAEIGEMESVVLFVERARAARSTFTLTDENAPAVAAICRRLDGLPLALELAAARIGVLSPEAILSRLDDRLTLLASSRRDLPERQRTLRGAMDWSHDLLGSSEQASFRRFSVFEGGADLAAIEAVVDPERGLGSEPIDLVAALVDRSLVSAHTTQEPRFAMLETIRDYAVERLASSGEEGEVRARHAAFYLDLATQHRGVATDPRRDEVLDRLDREIGNFRAVIRWALAGGAADVGLRLATALDDFWNLRNHLTEGGAALEELLAASAGDGATRVRAYAAITAAGLASWRADYGRSLALNEQAIAMAEQVGDRRVVGLGHMGLGWSTFLRQPDIARRHFETAIPIGRETDDYEILLGALQGLSTVQVRLGQLDAARASAMESLEVGQRIGNTYYKAFNLMVIGSADLLEGDLASATRLYAEALALAHAAGAKPGTAVALDSLAHAALEAGRHGRGATLAAAAARLRDEVGGGVSIAVIGFEEPLTRAERVMGPAEVASATAAGRAMSLEQAVAAAFDLASEIVGERGD